MAFQTYSSPTQFEVRFSDQVGGCERPHTHDALILSAVTQGSLTLQINGAELELVAGQLLAIGPDHLHCVQSYRQMPFAIHVLELHEQWLHSHHIDEKTLKRLGCQRWLNAGVVQTFTTLCQKILLERELFDPLHVLMWLQQLIELNKNVAAVPTITAAEQELLLAEWIRQQLEQCQYPDPPFAEIAKQLSCSKEHCNRIFRRVFNISIQSYFLNLKTADARRLLTGSQSLSDIALQCGFYDHSHFSRVFKAIYQVSPQQYREALMLQDRLH